MLERMGLPKEEETVKNAVSKVLAGLWFDRKLSRSSTVPHSGGVRVVPAELVYGSASRPTRSQTAPPSVRNGSEGAQSSHSQLRNEGVDPSAVQMVELQATGELAGVGREAPALSSAAVATLPTAATPHC